jgi:hypothetical protein
MGARSSATPSQRGEVPLQQIARHPASARGSVAAFIGADLLRRDAEGASRARRPVRGGDAH